MRVARERKTGLWIPVLICLLLVGTVWFGFRENEAETKTDHLFTALYAGNPTAVQAALAEGANPNSRQMNTKTSAGLLGNSRQWAAETLHPEETDTALLAAASTNKPQCVRLLLDRGANPNLRSRDGVTPLMEAAQSGRDTVQEQIQVMQMLLDKGADVNARDQHGNTALTRFIGGVSVGDYIGTVDPTVPRFLLSRGAKGNIKSEDGTTPLQRVIGLEPGFRKEMNVPIISLLMDYGADVNFTDREGRTPLEANAEWGSPAVVQTLLKHGVNPNAPTPDGETPLFEATDHGRIGIMKLLLDKGANVNAVSKDGIALAVAASYNRADMVKLLLDHGANVNKEGNGSDTPLAYAVAHHNVLLVRLLLAHGAKPSAARPDSQGETPLKLAIRRGYTDLIPLLR